MNSGKYDWHEGCFNLGTEENQHKKNQKGKNMKKLTTGFLALAFALAFNCSVVSAASYDESNGQVLKAAADQTETLTKKKDSYPPAPPDGDPNDGHDNGGGGPDDVDDDGGCGGGGSDGDSGGGADPDGSGGGGDF